MRDQKRKKPTATGRAAFTLVEMLVSVALVLLMMTLFASIFQMASGSMAKQRGISENDQRARTLATIMRKDLQHRNFRYMLPYYPGENSATSPTSFSNRTGYFYLSTNDPYSGLDDLLQFTISANIVSEDSDSTPLYGRAVELLDRRTDGPGAAPPGLTISPNQPETDDGTISPNFSGSSSAAEICYFVRNGNLYRRVLLIREPIAFAGQNLAPQPTSRNSYDYFFGQPDLTNAGSYDGLFAPNGAALTNDFYRLFDYSAFASRRVGGLQQANFLGVGSLVNDLSGAAAETLGNPSRRFGFNPIPGSASFGMSREHNVLPTAGFGPSKFLGRPTLAEVSTTNFNWPQATSRAEPATQNFAAADSNTVLEVDMNFDGSTETATNGNPFDVLGCPLALNPGNGLISAFDAVQGTTEGRGGVRRMEDLLLANVHEMKVELWDERLQRFVTPGHNDTNPFTLENGDYHSSRNLNTSYGPLGAGSSGRVFDTWHPGVDLSGDGIPESSPYVPYLFYPPRTSDTPPGPSPTGMAGPVKTYWQAGTYVVGDIVFAPVVFDGDGIFEWPTGPGTDDVPDQAFQIGYRCIAATDTDGDMSLETGGTAPVFPMAAGRRFTDGELTWESFDNRRPLRAIRLQIRYNDKASDQMRQLSIVMPMSEQK